MTALLDQEKWKRYHRISWGLFDSKNSQHMLILSLCRQAGWTVPDEKYGEVADLKRLQRFLKSDKSPIQKPLKKQSHGELSKTIKAMEGVVKHKWSPPPHQST